MKHKLAPCPVDIAIDLFNEEMARDVPPEDDGECTGVPDPEGP